jgi:tetratricopeptide (TPR) repeat protein
MEDDQYQRAVRLLERSADLWAVLLENEPDDASTLRDLAATYYDLGLAWSSRRSSAESQRAHKAAIRIYERLVLEAGSTMQDQRLLGGACCNLAIRLNADGKLDMALDYYGKSIRTLGELVAARAEDSTAKQYLRNAYSGRGQTSETTGEYQSAIEDYTRAIAANPDDDYYCHYRRGRVWAKSKNWDKAADDFEKAVALDPEQYSVWQVLSAVRICLSDREGYRQVCRQILERFGETEEATRSHSIVWICTLGPDALVEFDQCIELAEEAVAAKPDSSVRQSTLGAVLYRSGDVDGAREHLTRSVELHGKGGSIRACLFLAMTHHRLGDEEKAQEWLEKAVKLVDAERIRDDAATGDARESWYSQVAEDVLRKEAEALILGGEE